MLTLAQVEAAADRLPAADRLALLRHLQVPPTARTSPSDRDQWMRQLAELRASLGTATPSLSSGQVIDDLRAE